MTTYFYDPETQRSTPSYSCSLCHDRRRIAVPLRGEEWDVYSGYIEGEAVSIPCPDCVYYKETQDLLDSRRRWGLRTVELDEDYVGILRKLRQQRLTDGEREGLRREYAAAKQKLLGKFADMKRVVPIQTPEEAEAEPGR